LISANEASAICNADWAEWAYADVAKFLINLGARIDI